MKSKMYIVNAKNNGSHFPKDYFPRKIYYKKDAKILANEAILHGCEDVTINNEPVKEKSNEART